MAQDSIIANIFTNVGDIRQIWVLEMKGRVQCLVNICACALVFAMHRHIAKSNHHLVGIVGLTMTVCLLLPRGISWLLRLM